jgi:hypothetical protein
MILSLAQWAQSTAFFTALRSSWYVYPVVLSLHLLGIAIFGGMVLVTNMRLLGLAFRDRSVSDVIDQLRVPKRFGLVLVATCGLLMLGAKAEEYYYNIFFRLKLVILGLIFVHGWIFRRSVYYALELDRAGLGIPGRAKLAASLSILLWVGVACAGRGIGYIDPPLDKIHASLTEPPAILSGRNCAAGSRLQAPLCGSSFEKLVAVSNTGTQEWAQSRFNWLVARGRRFAWAGFQRSDLPPAEPVYARRPSRRESAK